MQRNRILTTALAGGLVIGAASTGYVIAQVTSASGTLRQAVPVRGEQLHGPHRLAATGSERPLSGSAFHLNGSLRHDALLCPGKPGHRQLASSTRRWRSSSRRRRAPG